MNYRNPIYTQNNLIDCEIEHPTYGWIPFTCDPTDSGSEFNTAELFEEMQPYALPYTPPSTEEIFNQNRLNRISELKQLLTNTDYVALSDYDKDKPEILAQRQAWRDEIRLLEEQLQL
jgi:hypothetical protein